MPIPQTKEKYTYQDYITWPDGERWEIIDGIAYDMSPSPTVLHQTILLKFATIVQNALRGKTCIPGIAPTDIILSEDNIVQPDFFVVCDKDKIKKENVQGAPDLVVEILSPYTTRKDRWTKKNLYERFGVREYILLDPEAKYAERYILDESGKYNQGESFERKETLKLHSVESVEIPLWEVFEEETAPSE